MTSTRHRPTRQTVSQLKADIDRGRTGDKVPFPDPAAAPLGADEEAAGTPISSETIKQTRLSEAADAPAPPRREGRGYALMIMIGTIVATLAAAIATMAWRLGWA